jgi:two-component system OmpR family response regulator
VELIARVRALLRRPKEVIDNSISYHDVTLNRDTFEATRGDTRIELTAKEFALMEYLLSQPGRIITKDQIMQHVWNYDADILPNTVEVYIGYLRNKLDRPFPDKPTLINTRRGFGYYFGEKSV